MHPSIVSHAEGVPYFTPKQDPAVGTPLPGQDLPTVFTPLKIRDMTLQHRITVSPMCTYSTSSSYPIHTFTFISTSPFTFTTHKANHPQAHPTASQPTGTSST
ncbi:hypothetical protein IMZ48_00425 [Candidatus Bathyarchaeota archaeon]|nr:hypothetical protein [Candidatus Bathyarchaeota archaeon]